MDNFWILEASKKAKAPVIPGTSKWIASEMTEFSSMVCSQSKVFEDSIMSNFQWLNDQINEIIYFDDDVENTSSHKMMLLLKSPRKSPVRLLPDQNIADPVSADSPKLMEQGGNKENTSPLRADNIQPVHLDFDKKPILLSSNEETKSIVLPDITQSVRKKKSSIAINPLYLSSPVENRAVQQKDAAVLKAQIESQLVFENSPQFMDSPLRNRRPSNINEAVRKEITEEKKTQERKSKLFAPLPSRAPLFVASSQQKTKRTRQREDKIAKSTRANTLKRKINQIKEERKVASKDSVSPVRLSQTSKTVLSAQASTTSVDSQKRRLPTLKSTGLGINSNTSLSPNRITSSPPKNSTSPNKIIINENKNTMSPNKDDQITTSPGLGHYFSNALTRAKSIFKHSKLEAPASKEVPSIRVSREKSRSPARSAKSNASPIKPSVGSSISISSASTKNSATTGNSASTATTSGTNNSLVSRLMAPTESSAAKTVRKILPGESLSPSHLQNIESQDESPSKSRQAVAPSLTIGTNNIIGSKPKIGIGSSANTLYPKLPRLSPNKKLAKNLKQGTDHPKTPYNSLMQRINSPGHANSTTKIQSPLRMVTETAKRKLDEPKTNQEPHTTTKKRKTNSQEFKKIDMNVFKTPIAEKLKKESSLVSIKKTSDITKLSLLNDDEKTFLRKIHTGNRKSNASSNNTTAGQKTPAKNSLVMQDITNTSTPNQAKFNGSQLMKSTLIKNAATTAAAISISSESTTSNIYQTGNGNERINPPIMLTPNSSFADHQRLQYLQQQLLLKQLQNSYQSNKTKNKPKTVLPEIYSDSSDDEDPSVLKSWANSPELKSLLKKQQSVDPDQLFGPIGALNLEEIFQNYKHKTTKNLVSRSSSARWDNSDMLTTQEIETYKAEMGFKR